MDDGRRFGPFSDVDDAFDPQQVGALAGDQGLEKEPEGRPAHRCVADHAISADAVVVTVHVAMVMIMVRGGTLRSETLVPQPAPDVGTLAFCVV